MSPEKFRFRLLFLKNSRRVDSHLSVPVVKARFPLAESPRTAGVLCQSHSRDRGEVAGGCCDPPPLLCPAAGCVSGWNSGSPGPRGSPHMPSPRVCLRLADLTPPQQMLLLQGPQDTPFLHESEFSATWFRPFLEIFPTYDLKGRHFGPHRGWVTAPVDSRVERTGGPTSRAPSTPEKPRRGPSASYAQAHLG